MCAQLLDGSVLDDSKTSPNTGCKVFALDIGGSLAKLAYERTFRYTCSVPCHMNKPLSDNGSPPFAFYDYCEQENEGRRVCLVKFETRRIEECLDFICTNILRDDQPEGGDQQTTSNIRQVKVKVTGGGAYRFRELIESKVGIEFDKEDEMECLIRGCVFMLRNIPDELFFYDKHCTPAHVFVPSGFLDTFPFLLVNIGSGVSILKVDSPTSYCRVGGSSIGGGTFWGIGSLLSGGKYSFDELLELADAGDHRKVDMLVRDIYGGDYTTLGLPGDVIASSFGLAARSPDQPRCLADMVKSLLITVSNNIGQLACMYAKQHNLTRVLFGGFFIRGHGLTMSVITYAVNFWSAGKQRALFLRHEGYLGAVGAFVKAMNDSSNAESKTIWTENYVSVSKSAVCSQRSSSGSDEDREALDNILPAVSSSSRSFSLVSATDASNELDNPDQATFFLNDSDKSCTAIRPAPRVRRSSSIKRIPMDTNYLELDRVLSFSLEPFPLLEAPTHYVPDTWDLTQDSEARAYWLSCLESGVERHRLKAEESQAGTMPDASERSRQYSERYCAYLHELGQNPSCSGVLTVRCLLSAQQHFLREFGFGDAFAMQKKLENRSALLALPARLQYLSGLSWEERQFTLIRGLLAGNLFDWGAAEVLKFFSEAPTDKLGVPLLESTLAQIPPRPWLIDDYDEWIEAIRLDRRAYRCMLIFCDNSGPDVILGVLPFALEFLSRGTKVILAANSGPAINDVTFQELEILLRLIASHEPVVREALSSGRLLVAENGQSSPCLDLRLTASTLVQLIKRELVDLVVIEGMGRAVHTNLHARFRVDCLKVAVIKNAWLARRLGGKLYSVVFKFQASSLLSKDVSREQTPTTIAENTLIEI
ncbi:Type II pantothenate kinase [Paragonimus heterotremus]|uniref:4'-phosphopantetheine phosphatase n=1 Tax=Paragonimus heterotremus TaxID=100268 RepID=A0A8J4WV83_9TREM|nr:Type II pantothenate kinase [Paragonimus heterotremus]